MRLYTVHAPPADPRPERFRFVKDGFSWPALFFQPIWMLWHGLWVTLLGYIAGVLVVAVVATYFGDPYATVLALVGMLALGWEGNTIRRLSLESRRWVELGDAAGRNLAEAELRFFSDWNALPPSRRDTILARIGATSGGSAPESDEPIIGLFPEAER